MAVIIQGVGAPVSGSSVSTLTIPFPGTPSGQMLIAVFAVEGVSPGSGPWVSSSVGGGWSRTFFQEPVGGSGTGLEVWNTSSWSISSVDQFNLSGTQTLVGQGFVYTGQLNDGVTNAVRVAVSQAVSGSSPATPTIAAFTNETLIAVGADTLASPGFGTPNPVGSTQRADSARSGFATAELTLADYPVAAGGTIGPFTWPATASPGSAHGATGVFAIRPATVGGGQGGPMQAAMPPDMIIDGGWTMRFSALDPVTGLVVPGVKISLANVVGADISKSQLSDEELGPFMLVPGPDA